MKPRLYYLSPRDMRKNRADPVAIMKSCREFAKNGFEVVLVTPRVHRKENVRRKRDIWGLYGLTPSFQIVELWTYLKDSSSYLSVNLQRVLTASLYFLSQLVMFRLKRADVVYSKCYSTILPLILLRKMGLCRSRLVFEAAIFESKWIHRFVARNVDRVVIFNSFIRQKYIAEFGVEERGIYRPTFPSQFSDFHRVEKKLTRRELGIPEGQPVVLYSGKMDPSMKELHWILDSAKEINDASFVFVGLQEKFRSYFEKACRERNVSNVTFFGFQKLENLFAFVKLADILVSYYDAEDSLSANQRVPAKLTVYTCTGVPIVIADLPTHREWFGEDVVNYCQANDPRKLAERIREVIHSRQVSQEKAQKLLEFSRKNTFETSFEGISNFIKKAS